MRFNDHELDIRDLASPVFTIPVRREDMENVDIQSAPVNCFSNPNDPSCLVGSNYTTDDPPDSPLYSALWVGVIVVSVIMFIASIILTLYAINKTKNKTLKTLLIVCIFIPPMYPIVSIISLLVIFGVIN